MKFKNLTKDEFIKFSSKHEQANFYQTIEWAKLKKNTAWDHYLVGVKKNNKVIAAAMILSKKVVFSKKIMYAPRGFLLDYNNSEILEFFSKELKKFLKSESAIFLKLDPNLISQERDIEGKLVEDGINNLDIVNKLTELNYKHFGFNLYQETMQPRWMFITYLKNKTFEKIQKNYDRITRQIINKNKRIGIKTRELAYEELDEFKNIMQTTSDRRRFIDRPLSYYQDMYKAFEKSANLKITVAELHCKDAIKYYEDEINKLINERNAKIEQFTKNPKSMNEKRYYNSIEESQNIEKKHKKALKKIKEIKKEAGNIVPLAAVMFIYSDKEVVALIGGSYEKYMEYQAAYTIHNNAIKDAIENNYERYNFYGITGDFDRSNPLIGLYTFKKGFGGAVVELIGEFDLIISKFWFMIYKVAYKSLHFLKNLKTKIK